MNFDIANLVVNIGQANSKDWIDILSALLGIGSFITAICSIIYTAKSVQQQKEQWLNDTLIKNEYNVLLETKKILINSIQAINWFFTFVLTDFVIDNEFTDDELSEPNEFIRQLHAYHPLILKLYNYYKENYYIFKKYKLDNELKVLQFMLHISKTIDRQEYIYVVPEVKTKYSDNDEIDYYRYKFMDDVKLLFNDWLVLIFLLI